MTHIMLDIETLGTRPGAIVLSAALVRFSDEAHCAVSLAIPDQQALGLETDPSTAEWWKTQPPAAWTAATENAVSIADGLAYLATWLQWAEPDVFQRLIWCHGATFDAPILGELFRRAGIEVPWKFWSIQCTRTLYNLATVDVKAFSVLPPHVALNDALGQTRAAKAALQILAERRGLVQ